MIRDHAALVAFLHARADLTFDWGRNPRRGGSPDDGNSCVHFAAGAVQAQTGRNLMPRLPSWTTERGAKRVLKRLGGLEAATDRVLTRIPPAMAQRGDIAGVPRPGGGMLLMVVEGETLVGPDASGARRIARRHMAAAWSAV